MFIFPITPQGPQQTGPVDPAQAARQLQIIRGALVMGILMFLGVSLVIVNGELKFQFDMMEMIASGFAASALGVFTVIGRLSMNTAIPNGSKVTDEDKTQLLIIKIITTEIIKGAVLEGAAFFAIMLIIMSNSGIGLVIALLMVFISVVSIPTSGRIQNKLENLRHQLRC